MPCMNIHDKIEQLSAEIARLAQQQTTMSRRILELMDELDKLKREATVQEMQLPAQPETTPPIPVPQTSPAPVQVSAPRPINTSSPTVPEPRPPARSTLEEFIGGNVASKVGILITLIGIFIGAKYAIEHDLISPAMRIAAGYASGLLLAGIAWRLKSKYEQYSAVLMGGGLAVLYFITYTAYAFYALFPQMLSFALMLAFTVAAVYASMLYNRIIIAHLGLVGAYAIPVLLSDNSGRYAVLFSYITIINTGILALSFKKYWKSLFYVSFVFTWFIYGVFFVSASIPNYFATGMTFLCIFFFIFYATFLAYKLLKKEQYSIRDVMLLLSNAFIFYGYGYGLLASHESSVTTLALFTLANAAIHFVVGMLIKRLQLADKALLYLLLGLGLTFVTIAIPVQLDGNWVTLLWTIEALIIFYIGRTQQRPSYEKLAIIVSVISFFSLVQDLTLYSNLNGANPPEYRYFLNANFFTGLFVSMVFGAMFYLHRKRPMQHDDAGSNRLYLEFYNIALPFLFLVVLYFTIELELYSYLSYLMLKAANQHREQEIALFRTGVILLYSMIFAALAARLNLAFLRHRFFGAVTLTASILCIAILLLHGLPVLNELSRTYQAATASYFGSGNLLLRYATMLAAGMLLWLGKKTLQMLKAEAFTFDLYTVITHTALLTIISFEYLQWVNLAGSTGNQYRLGLSIVWSVYALALVVAGINKKKKYWRLTGIFFFIITLVKLFVYDLSEATTISKTVSFISLGAILLLVGYLYNRYNVEMKSEGGTLNGNSEDQKK